MNTNSYSDFTGVRADALKLRPGSVDPEAEGEITYLDGTGFRAYGESGVFTIPESATGGGSAVGDLDGVYSNGNDITIDEGAITLTDATTAALNTLELVKSGAGSGNVLDIAINAALTGNAIDIDMNLGIAANAIYIDNGATARTGADFKVKDDSTGNHSVIDIDSSGAGASVGFDWTESYNGSSTSYGVKLTLDNADGIDSTALQIVRGTGVRTAPAIDINDASTGSADLIDIDLTGVFTGNVIDFASSAAATGNVLNIDLDSAVAMTAIHVEGSGVRTQPMVEIATDCTGAADLIDISVTGVSSGNVIDVDMGAAVTGNMLDVDMNLAVASKAIYIDAGAGTRTAALVDLKHDGDGDVSAINIDHTNTGSGNVIEIDIDAVHTGNAIDINYGTGAATGNAINIATGTNLAGNALAITTAGVRTAPVINVVGGGTDGGTDDHIILITQSAVLNSNMIQLTYDTAASDGDAIGITMGTNVAGSALAINGTGVRTDDLIKIDSNQTGAGLVFDINMSGAGSGNVLDITYSAANTGDAIAVTMADNIAGSALVLSGTGTRTDDLIKIDSDDDGAVHDFDINLSGAGSGNVIDITYSVAADTGNAIDLNMGTNVAGMAISVASAATGTSGEGAAFDVEHTGNLAAGADLVTIHSTGSPSSTSNLLSIEQDTGAGTSGAYGLYINCTGTNVEAIKVDAGNVVLDEALSVGGALTVTGASTLTGKVTATAGVQSASVAITATDDGTGTGAIPAGTRYATVDCDGDANHIVTLPAATIGNIITIYVGATGCEIRTPAASNVKINGVDSDGTNELAITATSLVTATCIGTTDWIVSAVDEAGDVITPLTPDAA